MTKPSTEERFYTPVMHTRRSLLASATTAAVGMLLAQRPAQAQNGVLLNATQKQRLLTAIAPLDTQYDDVEDMLKRTLTKSADYHSTITGVVHPTQNSLQYAVANLDCGDDWRRRRAQDILRRVIALQDKNPSSPTYGLWSWYLEEPLSAMSPPDQNWADFCGVQLLQVAIDHRNRLPIDIQDSLREALRHASNSIRTRNVGLSYTNIAIMGTYVTLAYSELYADAGMKAYALDRLSRFHQYSLDNGAFAEYNSPAYTIIALKELGRLRQHITTPEAQPLIADIYRMAWEEIATHFHVPSRQWAGPHSRTYSTLLEPSVLSLIQRSTDGRVDFGAAGDAPTVDEHRLLTPCPTDLEANFLTAPNPARTLVKTFIQGTKPTVGTTHLAPIFTLGSINRDHLWNQRRVLLGYWGTPEAPSYMHMRFLHDGYDFAAARYWGRQINNRTLGGIDFATDGGDTHPSLDRIVNGTITATDMRVRFEFGGDAANAVFTAPTGLSAPLVISFGALRIRVTVPYAKLGATTGYWTVSKSADNTKVYADVVLYSGPSKTFVLRDLQEAAVGVAVQMTEGYYAMAPVPFTAANDRLSMDWNGMKVSIPLRPDVYNTLNSKVTLQ